MNVGLYIALFPQLIAGPIVRYDTIEDQIMNRRESMNDFCSGMQRFIYGLAKKVLIANYVAQVADNIFDSGTTLSVATAWLGAVAYTLQIYFDFSGYSDMAIGLGRMFGFKFPENFNYPYISKSAAEFWHRWHISLGSWFKDYVYIPLGGSKVSTGRWIFNMFVVWSLTGLWHGANWTFLFWGLFYFVLLLAERFTRFPKRIGYWAYVYSFFVIIIGRTIFRSPDIQSFLHYLGMMFGVGSAGITDYMFNYYISGSYVVMAAGILFCFPVIRKLREIKMFNAMEPVLSVMLFLLTLINVISSSYNPFIYFNF